MSDFYHEPGTAVVPAEEYIEELRDLVRGNIAQVALFGQYVTMVADSESLLERGATQPEIDRLAWLIGLAQKVLEHGEEVDHATTHL
jgi:hypothetical protein